MEQYNNYQQNQELGWDAEIRIYNEIFGKVKRNSV